jgi:glycerol kinase
MQMLDLPEMAMPEVRPTIYDYGETKRELFGYAIPIACVIGDQYASLFGQGCLRPGMAKCTLGTGGFFIVNIGPESTHRAEGIFSRICWHLGDGPTYGLEGAIYHVGTLLEWLCNKLNLVKSIEQIDATASGVESMGVYLVPAFSGLASPFWDPAARTIIVGPSLNTGPVELIRAGLEAVAFQLQDIVEAMKAFIPEGGLRLRFDGNAATNNTLMQIVADQLQSEVERSGEFGHRSALGAAFLAGLCMGEWQGLDEVASMWHPDKVFYPKKPARETEELYEGWKEAVNRSRGLAVRK